MAPNLPGFYWDEEKQKYFKIQPNHRAPPNAAWSRGSVQRRQDDDDREAAVKKRRIEQSKRVTRAKSLGDPVVGGVLQAQCGIRGDGALRGLTGDVVASTFAEDLTYKGEIAMGWEDHTDHYTNCIYVNGSDEKTGLGYVYAEASHVVKGHYLARNKTTDDIDLEPQLGFDKPITPGNEAAREPVFCSEMSSLKYHAKSHTILVTSRATVPGRPMLQVFSPELSSPDANYPHWRLGECHFVTATATRPANWALHDCAPFPSSAPPHLHAILASSHGLLAYSRTTGDVTTPPSQGLPELFAVDFLADDHNLVLSAGRPRSIHLRDLRVMDTKKVGQLDLKSVLSVKTTGPTAHVKSAGGHVVVAAGPGGTMALYDVRYVSSSKGTGNASKNTYKSSTSTTPSRPVLTFADYANKAHICNIGFDVLPAPGRGLVAAATDDGRVGLWSLRSGRKLVEDVLATEDEAGRAERLRERRGGIARELVPKGVVRALQWERLPRDINESLFVGVGLRVKKFSFGRALEEESFVDMSGY